MTGQEGDEMVTVPFEYLLSTHVQISAAYDKFKEMLGEGIALSLFAIAADAGLPARQPTPSASVEELRKLLREAGYELTGETKGDLTEFRLACPYADRIHPHLGTRATFCPMSQMVLSTMRKKFPKSVVTETKLVQGGSAFTIKAQE